MLTRGAPCTLFSSRTMLSWMTMFSCRAFLSGTTLFSLRTFESLQMCCPSCLDALQYQWLQQMWVLLEENRKSFLESIYHRLRLLLAQDFFQSLAHLSCGDGWMTLQSQWWQWNLDTRHGSLIAS